MMLIIQEEKDMSLELYLANSNAVASPIPDDAPVINTTRPDNSVFILNNEREFV